MVKTKHKSITRRLLRKTKRSLLATVTHGRKRAQALQAILEVAR